MDRIRILATSDVHGYITPYSYANRQEVEGGLTKLAPLIAELRDENTILVDNGDTIQGSPLLYYHHLKHADTINPMATIMNAMNYDYLNTGNHEFNYGYHNAMRYYEDSKAKWICGNVNYQNKPINKPYVIHEFPNGRRIALIAAVTDYITNWEQPRNIVDVSFSSVFDFVKETVELIKKNEKVDATVLLYHGGYECDLETGEPTEAQTGENVGSKICKEIDGIDVIVSGHQHRSIATYVCGKCTTQTAYNAKELAVIDLEFGEELKCTPRLLSATSKIDEEKLALINELEEECQTWLDEPLGELDEGDLLLTDSFDARVHKHRLVSFLNQIQLECSGADISAIALANETVGFKHSISMRDIVATYVFPNTLVVVNMKGKDLLAYMEQCAEYFTLENGELKVASRFLLPKPSHYNYDMFDGISYTIDVREPIGKRIKDVFVKEEPLDLEKNYHVCVNNYRSAGGGNFEMFKNTTIHYDPQRDVVECIADYIGTHKIVHVEHTDNIKVVY